MSVFRQLHESLVIACAVLQRINTNILRQSSELDSESLTHACSACQSTVQTLQSKLLAPCDKLGVCWEARIATGNSWEVL